MSKKLSNLVDNLQKTYKVNKGMKELEKEERKEQKKFAEMLKKQMENE